jgi:hypothetical protein
MADAFRGVAAKELAFWPIKSKLSRRCAGAVHAQKGNRAHFGSSVQMSKQKVTLEQLQEQQAKLPDWLAPIEGDPDFVYPVDWLESDPEERERMKRWNERVVSEANQRQDNALRKGRL